MSDEDLSTTLAYKKSPKTSKRTSFQDELQAAISARARRSNMEENYSYGDDFEEDDALEELLNFRKSRMEMFKAGKKKAVDFQLSDTSEDRKALSKTRKRVSFESTGWNSSPILGGPSDSRNFDRDEQENGANGSSIESPTSSRRDRSRPKSVQFCLSDRTLSDSPPPLLSGRSEETQEGGTSTEDYWGAASLERLETDPDGESQESVTNGLSHEATSSWRKQEAVTRWKKQETLTGWKRQEAVTDEASQEPTPGEKRQVTVTDGKRQETVTNAKRLEKVSGRHKRKDTPAAEEHEGRAGREKQLPVPQPRERSLKTPASDSDLKEEFPKPRPRQRVLKEENDTEKGSVVEQEAPLSTTNTSSVSIPLSSASSAGEVETFREPSPQWTEEDGQSILSGFSHLISSVGEQPSDAYSRSSEASDVRDFTGRDEPDSKQEYGSTSFEDYQEDDGNSLDGNGSGQSHVTEKSQNSGSLTQSMMRPKSAQTAESRYLGTLKVLDQFASQTSPQPEMADSVRATVYQQWLKSKKKVLHETLKVKKQEEQMLEEKKQQEAISRKEDAKASFTAWSKKKEEVIKAKAKEKQDLMKKQQQEIDEKQEKKETAKKQVFEKWKKDQDKHLKEKHRKQKLEEEQLRLKKEEEAEERKKDSISTFSKWYL
ncbi:hypothetical protein AGOR_G00190490 [Albula goreensis]|uniref:Microtubule-associated protein 9 n=1 Tax=Albula goreensis TaxID=1534307 RepID=A0A8T3CSX7_9TELE|nr:hypothetical protein AGOR_G00190490 [Albula goreensis]